MAGYSGTPLTKKLGIKPGHVVLLLGAPANFAQTLGELPPDVTLRERGSAKADVILFFTKSRTELAGRFPTLAKAIFPDRALWICWPKKSSRVATDVTEDVLRELGLPLGIVDVKVCAVDDTWSGLKFMVRTELRG